MIFIDVISFIRTYIRICMYICILFFFFFSPSDKHEIPINQSVAFDTETKSTKELFPNKGVTPYVGNMDQASDVDEDDEDLLAACINIGMQNNR